MTPAALLSTAIVGRELRRTARLRSTYIVRGVFLLLLTGIVGLIFYEMVSTGRGSSAAAMSALGRQLYVSFFLLEMVLALLVCPVLMCGAVADETEDRTIEVLLTAPIRRFALVLSKFVARMAFAVALLVASIPVMMGCLSFGGVAPLEVGLAGVLVLGLGCWAGALTLLFSTLVRKGFIAALMTYFLILGWSIGVFIVRLALGGFGAPSGATTVYAPPFFFGFFVAGDPSALALVPQELAVLGIATLAGLWLASRFVGRGLSRAVPREAATRTRPTRETRILGAVGAGFLIASIAGGIALVIAWLLPSSYWEGFERAWAPFLVCLFTLSWALARGVQSFFYRGRGYQQVWNDPFLWKEVALEGPRAGRISATVVAGTIAAVGILCLPDRSSAGEPGIPTALADLMLGLMLVLTSVVGASGVTSEREQGMFDLLLVSPVAPRRILDGKLCGAISQLWPVGAFFFAYEASALALGTLRSPAGLALGTLVVVACVYFQGALACTLSLCLRRSTTAILAALAVPFSLYAGWPILYSILAGGHPFDFFLAFQPNPFFFLSSLLLDDGGSEVREYAIGFYPGLILHLAFFIAAGYALRAWAAANFHRWARLGLE